MKTFTFSALLFLTFITPILYAQNCWLSLEGKGKKNGLDAENAYPSQKAQRCWNETSEEGTMYVMEGVYTGDHFWRLHITSKNDGPEIQGYKTLQGKGSVRLMGTRPIPYRPQTAEAGEEWLQIGKGAKRLRIENFSLARIASGIQAVYGKNDYLQFKNISFEDTRQNIFISGKDSHEILLQDISGVRYSKRHIRLGGEISKIQVINAQADSEFLDGDFAVGFDVENFARDIEFRNCVSRRNRYTASEYWNGDGFKAEAKTKNIRWIGCSAFENADAGFDIKTPNAILKDIVAEENSRNIRIWHSAVLENIHASRSQSQGGNASQAGIWAKGKLDCHHCTLKNNAVQVHTESSEKPFAVHFFDSLLFMDKTRAGVSFKKEERTQIDLVRTNIVEN